MDAGFVTQDLGRDHPSTDPDLEATRSPVGRSDTIGRPRSLLATTPTIGGTRATVIRGRRRRAVECPQRPQGRPPSASDHPDKHHRPRLLAGGNDKVDPDEDETPHDCNACPDDPEKAASDRCGCGITDTDLQDDLNSDGVFDIADYQAMHSALRLCTADLHDDGRVDAHP